MGYAASAAVGALVSAVLCLLWHRAARQWWEQWARTQVASFEQESLAVDPAGVATSLNASLLASARGSGQNSTDLPGDEAARRHNGLEAAGSTGARTVTVLGTPVAADSDSDRESEWEGIWENAAADWWHRQNLRHQTVED